MVDKTTPETINEIVDDYWSFRIEDQCDTQEPEANRCVASDIIEQLLEELQLHKTLASYRKVRWGGDQNDCK